MSFELTLPASEVSRLRSLQALGILAASPPALGSEPPRHPRSLWPSAFRLS